MEEADVADERQGVGHLHGARHGPRRLREQLDDHWITGLERLRDAAEAARRATGDGDGRAGA